MFREVSVFFFFLQLLLSGNVQPNSGPMQNVFMLEDLKSRSRHRSLVHRSLLPEMDLIKLWVVTMDMDIMMLSETWLKQSISDNIYRSDRVDKSCDLC